MSEIRRCSLTPWLKLCKAAAAGAKECADCLRRLKDAQKPKQQEVKGALER